MLDQFLLLDPRVQIAALIAGTIIIGLVLDVLITLIKRVT